MESRAWVCARVSVCEWHAATKKELSVVPLKATSGPGCKGRRGFVNNMFCFAPQDVFTLCKKALARSSQWRNGFPLKLASRDSGRAPRVVPLQRPPPRASRLGWSTGRRHPFSPRGDIKAPRGRCVPSFEALFHSVRPRRLVCWKDICSPRGFKPSASRKVLQASVRSRAKPGWCELGRHCRNWRCTHKHSKANLLQQSRRLFQRCCMDALSYINFLKYRKRNNRWWDVNGSKWYLTVVVKADLCNRKDSENSSLTSKNAGIFQNKMVPVFLTSRTQSSI